MGSLHPFIPVFLCFLAGLFCSRWMESVLSVRTSFVLLVLLLAAASFLTFASRYEARRRQSVNGRCYRCLQYAFSLLAFILFFLMGHWRMSYTHSQEPPASESVQTYDALVLSQPEKRTKSFRMDLLIVSGAWKHQRVRAYLYDDKRPGRLLPQEGMAIRVASRLEKARAFVGNGKMDYVTFLKTKDIFLTTRISPDGWQATSVSLRSLSVRERLQWKALQYRKNLMAYMERVGLKNHGLSVVSAMTLGQRQSLDKDLRQAYSDAGVSHLLALSGMHLSILYVFFSLILFRRYSGAVGMILTLLAVWAYVLLVGMMPSVTRAALMITLCSIFQFAGRRALTVDLLFFSAFIQLLYNPYCLADIGFQLSYLSVLSILLVHVPLQRLLYRIWGSPLLRWLSSAMLVSLVAQLGVAPLVIYYFGNFSLVFLVANLLMVPLATLTLYGAVMLLFLWSIPSVHAWVVWVVNTLVEWQVDILRFLSSLPYASLHDLHLNLPQTGLLYVVWGAMMAMVQIVYRHQQNEDGF